MSYHLKDFHRDIPDQELLDDLNRVAQKIGVSKLSSREYDNNGAKFTSGTICTRFNSWNKALEKANLGVVHYRVVSEKDLFLNIEQVWINIGKQPVFRDMTNSNSKYSTHQYLTKFGTWRNALKAFIQFINLDKEIDEENEIAETSSKGNQGKEIIFKHKTKRFPSERLKVQVLMRDGNKCKLCGITLTGDNIHFDHILAWSKGGETTLENIQVLCETHNLAKGNIGYNDL